MLDQMNCAVPFWSILGNALEKRSLIFHHDGAPQSNVSRNWVRGGWKNERSQGLLDVCVRSRLKGNDIEVCDSLVHKR